MVFDGTDDVGEMSTSVENDGDVEDRVVDCTGLVIARVRKGDAYRQAS